MSPLTMVDPVLVMVLPASTAYDEAVPRFTVAVAAIAYWVPTDAKVRKATPVTKTVKKENRNDRRELEWREIRLDSQRKFVEW
jgi:hypothetical protein